MEDDNVIEQGQEPDNTHCAEVCVQNELGLHARPAAMLAKEAQKFDADILLVSQDQEVDAKSILDILTLAAPQGCGMTVKAMGEDAAKALSAIKTLFSNRFGEDK